jgi:rSAM/selenodomain-associated transferase 1
MNGAIAVFVKTPGRSDVKTRLAAVTGVEWARAFYRRAVQATASVVERAAADIGCTPYWAVAEPQALAAWSGFDRIAQGTGDLGARMAHVHAALVQRHRQAILIGADCPQLDARDLRQALSCLQQPDPTLVLGPAADGGFWLVGSNIELPVVDWTAVRYSRADTRTQFVDRMRRHADVVNLRELRDVDGIDDVAPMADALECLEQRTPGQQALLHWVRGQPWASGAAPADAVAVVADRLKGGEA